MSDFMYSVLSPCPEYAADSPLGGIIDFWRNIGPLWSPLADIGILLAVLGLLVPLLCVLVGAGFCIHYVKETIVALYLGYWGEHITGDIIGMYTQHWADSSTGTHTYCRASVRYRHFSYEDIWYRKDFIVKKRPMSSIRIDLLVSRTYPKVSRIREQEDLFLARDRLFLFAKLVGLLLISIVVGGLLLTMMIEIAPRICPFKTALWAIYAVLYAAFAAKLLRSEIKNGAVASTDNDTSRGEGHEGQSENGYEYIPDIPLVSEDQPPALPTALPVADPVSSICTLLPFAAAYPVRSIFGLHRTGTGNAHDLTSQEDAPTAIATLI